MTPVPRAFSKPQFLAGPGAPTSQVTVTDLGSVGVISIVTDANGTPAIQVTGHMQSYTTSSMLVLGQLTPTQNERGIAVPIDLFYTKTDECGAHTSPPTCTIDGSDTGTGDIAAQIEACVGTAPPAL
jgi:hypothetical protein